MSDIEEPTSPVRKTRSGRAVKTPAKPKAAVRATNRKTRKKVVVMEVDASDEDIENTEEHKQKKAKLDDEDKLLESDTEDPEHHVEETLLNSGDEEEKLQSDSGELILNDISMLEEAQEVKETGQHKIASKGGVELQSVQELSEDISTLENGVHFQEEKERLNMDLSENISEPDKREITFSLEVTTDPEKKETISELVVTSEPAVASEDVTASESVVAFESVVASESAQEEVSLKSTTSPVPQPVKLVSEQISGASQLKDEEVERSPKATSPKVQNGEPEAENISDDELPAVPVAKVPETEEVSDDELPGPKRAELPADTEVVSEDELPVPPKRETEEENTKKEGKRKLSESGYDPTSPTSEGETSVKKAKEDKEEKEGDAAKAAKPKKLPELDKYWKAVNDDPTDFTGWTYLLQYVDQENDMEAAREAYDAFLSHYPYCYGYWRKYADYEKRKGNKKKCEEVFERGLKAIPLSVDLWIHYLTYVKSAKGEDEEYVRSQFERAIAACGLEFRSDRLWDSYIKWEADAKRLQKVTAIYDRLLTTPTQCYTTHFDNFQEHVSAHAPNKILDVDEFMALRKEVRAMLKSEEKAADNADLPPGDEDSKLYTTEEETKCIRERIVSIRRKIHKNTVNAVTARWNFEEGIKRPYFHVKPLERCQLKNWQDYLDYEIEQGDRVRIIVLFERCLIACALYEEFWLKFVGYLENLKDAELQPKIRDVYERACTIHHLKKPSLHLQWAVFEETVGSINRAAEILVNLEKQVPNVLQVAYRRINLERRRRDFEKCQQLFEHYVNNSKNKMISSNISIKYSRFCLRVLKDFDKAHEILKSAITKDPHNPRLYLQLVDLILQKNDVEEEEVCSVFDEFLEKEGADPDQKALFGQRKVEYLEDFGSSVQHVQAAQEQYQKLHKLCKDTSKKKDGKTDSGSSSSSKKEKPTSTSASQSQSYGNYNYGNSTNQPPYNYSGAQQGQYNYTQYGQGDQYQYQNWQYPQGGAYGGYNQWGGYTGGYGY